MHEMQCILLRSWTVHKRMRRGFLRRLCAMSGGELQQRGR